jgi:hypothetical protein
MKLYGLGLPLNDDRFKSGSFRELFQRTAGTHSP